MAVAPGGGGAQAEPVFPPDGYINYFVRVNHPDLELYSYRGARFGQRVRIETGNNTSKDGLEMDPIPEEFHIPADTSIVLVHVPRGRDMLFAGPRSKMTPLNEPGGAGAAAGDPGGGGARAAGAAAGAEDKGS